MAKPTVPPGAARAQRGFTLIELMVTVLVMVILAAVAAPAIGDYILRSRVRAAADGLVDQLSVARSQAVRMDRNVSFKVVTSGTNGSTWCAGARQYTLPGGSVEGYTLASGDAPACDCSSSTDVANCTVTGNRSVVASTDFTGVEMSAGNGTVLQFDRKLGTLTDLTLAGTTLSVRSTSKPTRYRVDVKINAMGHAKACIPSGFAMFGGYKSC